MAEGLSRGRLSGQAPPRHAALIVKERVTEGAVSERDHAVEGHKTDSMFRRSNILDENRLKEEVADSNV